MVDFLINNSFLGDATVYPAEFRFYTNDVNSNTMLGRLFEKDGKLHFEGDVDESAKKFIDHLCESFSRRIDEIVDERCPVKLTAYEWKFVLGQIEDDLRIIGCDRDSLNKLWSKIASQLNKIEL